MADPSPAVQLTPSTRAALQRIATAPATSEQGLSGAAQCIAIPGHNPSTEWLAGFQAPRRATHEQLHKLAQELEGHGPH